MVPPVTGITPVSGIQTPAVSSTAEPGFGTLLNEGFGAAQASAAAQEQSFALGRGTVSVTQAVSSATQADLRAEEASLLISKALASYQSIMAMQV